MEAVLAAAALALQTAVTPVAEVKPEAVAWAVELAPIHVYNVQTLAEANVRLYADDGSIDDTGARAFDRVMRPKDDPPDSEPKMVNRRTLQLLVKAANHFHAKDVTIISVFRASAGKKSKHRTGEAIDFAFPAAPSGQVAKYLRTLSRVGVGIYTHPRTQFVHLDVRDESFHWLDASPPGRTWREKGITDHGAEERDRAYDPIQDLPIE